MLGAKPSLWQRIYGGRPQRQRHAKELMPNLLLVVMVITAIVLGLEYFDYLALSEAQALLMRENLTPTETRLLVESLEAARESDAANDDLVKYAVGAIGGVLLALTQRNGHGGGDRELDKLDAQIRRLEQ